MHRSRVYVGGYYVPHAAIRWGFGSELYRVRPDQSGPAIDQNRLWSRTSTTHYRDLRKGRFITNRDIMTAGPEITFNTGFQLLVISTPSVHAYFLQMIPDLRNWTEVLFNLDIYVNCFLRLLERVCNYTWIYQSNEMISSNSVCLLLYSRVCVW